MPPLAIFGITNDGLNLAVNLLLLFLVVLWLALVYWTHADARRRIGDPMLVGCATAAALFPFVGTIVYMVVRPPEYLEDVHEREIEIAAAEARLAAAQEQACPYCEFPVERSFLRCPSCLRRLKEPCGTCGKPLDPRWRICPYCETEVPERRGSSKQRRGGSRGRDRPPDDERSEPKRSSPAAKRGSGSARSVADDEPRPIRESERPASEDEPATTARSRPSDTTEVKRPGGRPARQ